MTRRDELGPIAAGLNEMLDQLERFNQSLHDRIEEATRDLSLRNAQLAASQSELFALRESLARAERVAALGQVAANVAHQAGTPLNLVSGYVQMIRDDPRTDDRIRSRLRTVDHADSAGHARAADDARPRAAAVRVRSVVNLADIIERVREVAQPRLSRSQHSAAGLGRRGSAGRQGGRHATGDGAAQPGHQRARRDARRRHAVDCRARPRPARRPPRGRRHGLRDPGGGHGPPVRIRG